MSAALNKMAYLIDVFLETMLSLVIPPGRNRLLQPITVEKEIEKAIESNAKVFRAGLLIPSEVEIWMNDEDFACFRKIEKIYKAELEKTANSYIKSEFKNQVMGNVRIRLKFKTDPSLEKGMVRVTADFFEDAYEDGLKG